MELREALNRRRSIRSYTGELADPDQLEAIFAAAYEAPVGMGRYEGIHLTVVTRPGLLAAIDAAAARMFGNPDAHPLYGAPMLVVVSSDAEGNVASANAAAVIQNMSLAAVDQGVGSCYIYGATRAGAGRRPPGPARPAGGLRAAGLHRPGQDGREVRSAPGAGRPPLRAERRGVGPGARRGAASGPSRTSRSG
ncbi:hypothetical protein HF885_04215 [Olsenella umbonata]|uniref:Nitroreductase domain-containing protein n=1 Tax=Parafannyhessea umbonata TaxID=604330 RepID=A0A7X9Y026_9ACTN|nr:hypothetical protein [Parafannyhessea umbonata]